MKLVVYCRSPEGELREVLGSPLLPPRTHTSEGHGAHTCSREGLPGDQRAAGPSPHVGNVPTAKGPAVKRRGSEDIALFPTFCPKVIFNAGFTERCRQVWFCSQLGDIRNCNQVRSKRPGAEPNPREMCGIPMQRRQRQEDPKRGGWICSQRVTWSQMAPKCGMSLQGGRSQGRADPQDPPTWQGGHSSRGWNSGEEPGADGQRAASVRTPSRTEGSICVDTESDRGQHPRRLRVPSTQHP